MQDYQKKFLKAILKLEDARYYVSHHRLKKAEEKIDDVINYLVECSEHSKSIDINHSFNKFYFTIKEDCFCCKHKPPFPPFSLVSHKFFSKASAGTVSGSDLQIPVASFADDNGTAIMAFPTTFEYFDLFVNGILQENGVALVTPSQLTIKGGSVLDIDDPIALEFVVSIGMKGGDI